jgi:hypothetical protein
MIVMLRSAGEPAVLGPSARRVLGTVMPGASVYDVRTMSDRVADALSYAR